MSLVADRTNREKRLIVGLGSATEYYRRRLDRFPSGELSERPKGGARRRRADLLEPVEVLHLVDEVPTQERPDDPASGS